MKQIQRSYSRHFLILINFFINLYYLGLRRITELERDFLAPKSVTCSRLGSINEKSEILSEEEILIDLLAGDDLTPGCDLTPRAPRNEIQKRLRTPYTCRAALKNRTFDDLEQDSVGELSFNSSSDDNGSVICVSPCSRLPELAAPFYGINKNYILNWLRVFVVNNHI